jgi:hypothetical protein
MRGDDCHAGHADSAFLRKLKRKRSQLGLLMCRGPDRSADEPRSRLVR